MKLKTLGLAGLLATSGCIYNVDFAPQTPFYKDGKEIKVVVNNITTGTANANYSRKNDSYYITYNSGRMATIHPAGQKFAFFHEIGHIQLGHIGENVFMDKKMRFQAEKDADCYSGNMLKDVYHYTPEQFEEVFGFMRTYVRNLDREEALRECIDGEK